MKKKLNKVFLLYMLNIKNRKIMKEMSDSWWKIKNKKEVNQVLLICKLKTGNRQKYKN